MISKSEDGKTSVDAKDDVAQHMPKKSDGKDGQSQGRKSLGGSAVGKDEVEEQRPKASKKDGARLTGQNSSVEKGEEDRQSQRQKSLEKDAPRQGQKGIEKDRQSFAARKDEMEDKEEEDQTGSGKGPGSKKTKHGEEKYEELPEHKRQAGGEKEEASGEKEEASSSSGQSQESSVGGDDDRADSVNASDAKGRAVAFSLDSGNKEDKGIKDETMLREKETHLGDEKVDATCDGEETPSTLENK